MSNGINLKNKLLKKIVIAVFVLLVAAAGFAWFAFNSTHADTSTTTAIYKMTALDFIKEFQQNDSLANKKYAEKIITLEGNITSIEPADTTLNIKIADSTTGSYVIFAFQQQDLEKVKKLQEGQKVSIKGSCSGGAFSQILGIEFITFKRCSLN